MQMRIDWSVFKMHKYQLKEQRLDFSAFTENPNKSNKVFSLIYISNLLFNGPEELSKTGLFTTF